MAFQIERAHKVSGREILKNIYFEDQHLEHCGDVSENQR